MSKKYCVPSLLIIFFAIFFLTSNVALAETYRVGNEEKEGSAKDFVSDLQKKIDEELAKGLKGVTEELEKAVKIAESAIVITVSKNSGFIYISRMEDWTKQSSAPKEDKIDINKIGDKILELDKEGRDLTKVILIVDKDTKYKNLWKVISLYEKSLHTLERADVNSIRYIFSNPL